MTKSVNLCSTYILLYDLRILRNKFFLRSCYNFVGVKDSIMDLNKLLFLTPVVPTPPLFPNYSISLLERCHLSSGLSPNGRHFDSDPKNTWPSPPYPTGQTSDRTSSVVNLSPYYHISWLTFIFTSEPDPG